MGDHPGVEILLEAVPAVLPAEAGLLHAAEGRVDTPPRGAVQVHGAGADPPPDPQGPFGRRAPHRAGQPVDRVVGDGDRLLLGVVGDDGEDGAEDLLLGDGVVGLHVGDDGRLHEVAGAVGGAAAGDEPAALLAGPCGCSPGSVPG